MINKTYLYPIRTSDYSNGGISCHVMGCWPALFSSNKNSLHSKLELPSHKMFQLSIPSSGILYPSPHSPKNLFKLSSSGGKNMSL